MLIAESWLFHSSSKLELVQLIEYFSKSLPNVILVGILGIIIMVSVSCSHSVPPEIDVWYGSEQFFGQRGNPQKWVNILGCVSSEYGIASLTYSLNGEAAEPLSTGPNGTRLANPGDFNIDIDTHDLKEGANAVTITATDSLHTTAVRTVTVNYSRGQRWPLPYSIDF